MSNSDASLSAVEYDTSGEESTPLDNAALASYYYNMRTFLAPLLNKYNGDSKKKAFLIYCVIQFLRLTRPHNLRSREIEVEEEKFFTAYEDSIKDAPKLDLQSFMREQGLPSSTEDVAIQALSDMLVNGTINPLVFESLSSIEQEVKELTNKDGTLNQSGGALNVETAEVLAACLLYTSDAADE